MDESPAQERRPGGAVEPVNRAAVAKARFQIPEPPPTARYELRDPFAEVIYQATTFDEMTQKADQLGATRFQAVSAQGKRTQVNKVDGVWQQPEPAKSTTDRTNVEYVGPPAPTVQPDPAMNSPAPPSQPSLPRIDAEAERAAQIARLQASLNERYLIKRAPVKLGEVSVGHTEYRYRGDTSRVAFTESTFRLATDNNSPSVARSMIDVAQARNWQALRVSGNEDFKRMVWLEASLRQVKTVGYEPVAGDLEVLRKEREARQVNRLEPLPAGSRTDASSGANKSSARGSGGRKAVLAALEAVLVAKHVPERQRAAVMAAAAENLGRRLAAGETHKIKIYDRKAPSRAPAVMPTLEQKRTREQAAPGR